MVLVVVAFIQTLRVPRFNEEVEAAAVVERAVRLHNHLQLEVLAAVVAVAPVEMQRREVDSVEHQEPY
jgi:hypothetical protein